MILAKNRHVDHCNRIKDPDIITQSYNNLIFNKKPKANIGEGTVFSTNGA
jgi:hypothetical protein